MKVPKMGVGDVVVTRIPPMKGKWRCHPVICEPGTNNGRVCGTCLIRWARYSIGDKVYCRMHYLKEIK